MRPLALLVVGVVARLAAGVAGLCLLLAMVAIIAAQSEPDFGFVVAWAALLGLPATLTAVAGLLLERWLARRSA